MAWEDRGWIAQIFDSYAASHGGVVRRSKKDVEKFASLAEVISAATRRGFHVIETGGQIVILCHKGALTIHV